MVTYFSEFVVPLTSRGRTELCLCNRTAVMATLPVYSDSLWSVAPEVWPASAVRPPFHPVAGQKKRPRPGTNVVRHPPGSGVKSYPSLGSLLSYGSISAYRSGVGSPYTSRHVGVGGTGGGGADGAVVLGSRVRTAARSVSPGATSAPQVEQTRPLLLIPSQTRQRQMLTSRSDR